MHLAVGWGVPQLKVGSFARSERMAKWNEALRIEEALGNAKLALPGAQAVPLENLAASAELSGVERRAVALRQRALLHHAVSAHHRRQCP